jgi:hypothetical protein
VQVYAVNTDQAWRIAVQILRWDGAGTIEEHHDQNVMLNTMPRYYNERWEPPARRTSRHGRGMAVSAASRKDRNRSAATGRDPETGAGSARWL